MSQSLPNSNGGIRSTVSAAQKYGEVIRQANRANAERLQGIELTVTRETVNRTVQTDQQTVTQLPDGGKVVEFRKPRSRSTQRLVALEDRVRVDLGGNGDTPGVTYWFDGVRWTEANTKLRRVAHLWPHQMSAQVLDPRDAAGVDPTTSLPRLLADSSLEKAETRDGSAGPIIATHNRGGQKIEIEFDASKAFLPVRSQLFHLSGAICRDARMTYESIDARQAWVVSSVHERIYPDRPDAADSAQWDQEIRTSVNCNILDAGIAQTQLAAVVPDGYRVVDFTDDATMNRPAARARRISTADQTPWKWLIIGHVVLLAVLGITYLRANRRRAVRA